MSSNDIMVLSDPSFGKRKMTGMISVAKLDESGFPEGLGAAFQFVNGRHAESNILSALEDAPEGDTWSGGKYVLTLVWRDGVVEIMPVGAKTDGISCNSSSEADQACADDAGPGRIRCGAERCGEGILMATFRRTK